jgi:hypothetical protein
LCVGHPSRTPDKGCVYCWRRIMFVIRVGHSGEWIVWMGVRHSEGNACVWGDDDLIGGKVELSDVSGLHTEIRSLNRLIQSKKFWQYLIPLWITTEQTNQLYPIKITFLSFYFQV